MYRISGDKYKSHLHVMFAFKFIYSFLTTRQATDKKKISIIQCSINQLFCEIMWSIDQFHVLNKCLSQHVNMITFNPLSDIGLIQY